MLPTSAVTGSTASCSSPAGVSLRGVQILLCLVSYDFEQQVHLEKVLEDVRDMCEAGARPQVIIYTAVAWPTLLSELVALRMFCQDLGGTVPLKMSVHSPTVKFNQTNFHREDMYSQLDQFDLFIYAERDLSIRPATAAAYLTAERNLRVCEGEEVWRAHTPAFLRYELNRSFSFLNDSNHTNDVHSQALVVGVVSPTQSVELPASAAATELALSPHRQPAHWNVDGHTHAAAMVALFLPF